jgi:putative aldouronate transport system permease protein
MLETVRAKPAASRTQPAFARLIRDLRRDRWIYLILMPGILYFVFFKYLPMAGLTAAFQNYQPFLGFTGSKWVGLNHFIRLFQEPNFYMLLKNTFMLSLTSIVFTFPAPIIMALMLNELRYQGIKRVIQSLIYVPHFISWVIIVSMFFVIFEDTGGLFQNAVAALGFEKFSFLMNPDWFRPVYIAQVIWKECGFGTIIYLAALAGVSPELYEAAKMDGAGRLRQIWHITLPGIRSTIVVLFIINLGHILDVSFEHVFLLVNSLNREVADVFDTYVYRSGIQQGIISYSTAVGMFKSLVGLVLVLGANWATKKLGEEGLW